MCHRHYALMGGFAFDACNMETNILPGGKQRLVLSPAGIENVTKIDISLVPDISEEHIRDKSKRSGLGKFLVCVQAFWFCYQCVVRLAHGLSISVLELSTLGHALCTFIICLMWWHKPYDVADSTLISGETAAEVAALFSTFRDIGRDIPVLYVPPGKSERQHKHYPWTIRLLHQALQSYSPEFPNSSKRCRLGPPDGFTRLYIRKPLYGFLYDAATLKSTVSEILASWGGYAPLLASHFKLQGLCIHVDLNPNQNRRFEMAQQAIARYQLDKCQLKDLESQAPLLAFFAPNHSVSAQYTPNMPPVEPARGYMPASLAFGLYISPLGMRLLLHWHKAFGRQPWSSFSCVN